MGKLMAVMLMVMAMVTVTSLGRGAQALSRERGFKHDMDLRDPDTGQEFELHSQGRVATLVELDLIPEVTRVACVGDRLLLKMTNTSPARGWKVGQVVVAGPGWGCNATASNGFQPQAIYVTLVNITFPLHLDTEVSLHHVPAGPFDMLEEASIHFHYDPGKTTHPAFSRASLAEKKRRFRRSALSNIVSNILNHIDWQANITATIPFNLGNDSDDSEPENKRNGSEPMTFAFHKNWGQKNLNVTRGQRAEEVKDDFVFFLDKFYGESELTYSFDLVIKNIDGVPQVVKYVNQYDLQTTMESQAKVSFEQEMGVTYNVTLDRSPTVELLRVPLIRPPGGDSPFPPVYLVVSYHAVSAATVSAYSAGKASVSTAFNASGSVTSTHQFDPQTNQRSDVTSRDWNVDAQEQNLRSPYRTHVDFSVYQQLHFTSAMSWHYHDVDIKLSPPTEITVHPQVRMRSTSPGVSRCVTSAVTVRAHVHAGKALFTADAFGLHLWNIPLQPALTRDLHLIDSDLGQGCDARCHGPSVLTSEALNASQLVMSFGREDPEFSRLRPFAGDQVLFHDTAASATWCGQPGTSCHQCSQHATNTSASMTCASRLMTSRAVAALTLLADLVLVEWPQRRVFVVEAWDEATSQYPTGVHEEQSLFRVGQALTLTLADLQGQPTDLSETLLERMAQLAVCAGFDHVEPLVNESKVEVGVAEDGWTPSDPDLEERRTIFWEGLENMDVTTLSPNCSRVPDLTEEDTWPPLTSDPALLCGPALRPLHRGHRTQMDTLIHWNLTEASLTFEAEGQAAGWCGYPSRPCLEQCNTLSDDLEPWNWCSTRMMTPRLAIRLRRLQKLAEEKNIDIRVLQAFTETSAHDNASMSLYQEGRAIKVTSTPQSRLGQLASLAVCAGFDVVSFTSSQYMEAFVRAQDGFHSVLTTFQGPSYPKVAAVGADDSEYSYPVYLKEENVLPRLLDGGHLPDTPLSQHVRLRDVMSPDRRYFRLDPSLLLCLELAEEDFPGTIKLIQGSVYRTRSENVRKNIDLRNAQEVWRFQAGQAMELRPAGDVSPERLLALATSVLRECPALVREKMRAVGLGCHSDRIYVDLRPLEAGQERKYVTVWEEGRTGYFEHVVHLSTSMILGGPVVRSNPDKACKDRGLDPGLEFLSFQLQQKGHCEVEGQAQFCRDSLDDRRKAAHKLGTLLTSGAGHGRLLQDKLHELTEACLVELCGGCAGAGPMFDLKVQACSRLVHYYVDRAASPVPPVPTMRDHTAFYNTHTRLSTVHALACTNTSVCVTNTPLHSLFVATVMARYHPDSGKSLESELFAADVNPTPLLELVAQEVAFRAKGKVIVYIESEADVYALRNVLKVLMVYNQNVSRVEFHVTPTVNKDQVTSSVQRKLEIWAGTACPRYSRFALTPFVVIPMGTKRHRRSAEQSIPRNKAMTRLYDWEQEWLDKML